jgi:hypothetical protein
LFPCDQVRECNRFSGAASRGLTASGISNNISDRHLLIVRRGPIPGGAKTKELFDAFLKAAGKVVNPSDDDLKTFVALRSMQDAADARNDHVAFEAWVRQREPLCETSFFEVAGLCPPPGIPPLTLSAATQGVPAQVSALPSSSAPRPAPGICHLRRRNNRLHCLLLRLAYRLS